MSVKIKGCTLKLEYSFILVISFCILLNFNRVTDVLLYSSVHELAHLAVLCIVGGKPDSLTLAYYGAALKYSTRLPILSELAVIVAGPLANLILYFISGDDINLVLFILNSLPVYPLDGGRVLNLFSYKATALVGRVLIVLLAVLSVYMIVVYKSFSLILITVYLTFYMINY